MSVILLCKEICMKHIIFISCSATQKDKKSLAKDLYQGHLFKKSLMYANHCLDGENKLIFIISTKHGLIPLEKEIHPYNVSPSSVKKAQKDELRQTIMNQIDGYLKQGDFDLDDKFTILAGKFFVELLPNQIKDPILPLKGKKYGEQLQFLNKALEKKKQDF